jgi:hypothetical protein
MNIKHFEISLMVILTLVSCNKVDKKNDIIANNNVNEENIQAHIANREKLQDNVESLASGEVLEKYRWTLPIDEWAAIKFLDNTYLLGRFGEGGEPFCKGIYEINKDEVIIYYPDEIIDWIYAYDSSKKNIRMDVWRKERVIFIYNNKYIDFYVSGCLKSDDKILKNSFLSSPVGNKYVLDGIDVLKYDYMKSHIVILENLRMRELPSLDSKTENLTIYFIGADNKKIVGDITFKNSIHSFDAITVEKDTIDGITAPWYRISVILNEVYSKSVWVFGGYVKEISESDYRNNSDKYYNDYYKALTELNLLL